jgi:hypothetical protein
VLLGVLGVLLGCTSKSDELKESMQPFEQTLKDSIEAINSGITQDQLIEIIIGFNKDRKSINKELLSEYPNIATEIDNSYEYLNLAQQEWMEETSFDSFIDSVGEIAMSSKDEVIIENGKMVLRSEVDMDKIKELVSLPRSVGEYLEQYIESSKQLLNDFENL